MNAKSFFTTKDQISTGARPYPTLSTWDPHSVRAQFQNAARQAEIALIAKNPIYKNFADLDQASFQVNFSLGRKLFETREKLLSELRIRLEKPPKIPSDACNSTTYLDMYALTLRELISEYENRKS